MNGPTGPKLPDSMWVLVIEDALWSAGLPTAVPTFSNPTSQADPPRCVIFARPEDAASFAGHMGLAGSRPLLLTDPIVFMGILTGKVSEGVRRLALYRPELVGAEMYECDAMELLLRLAEPGR